MKILILNGPNLNLLGKREPEIYGSNNFESYFEKLQKEFEGIELEYFQSGYEAESEIWAGYSDAALTPPSNRWR